MEPVKNIILQENVLQQPTNSHTFLVDLDYFCSLHMIEIKINWSGEFASPSFFMIFCVCAFVKIILPPFTEDVLVYARFPA